MTDFRERDWRQQLFLNRDARTDSARAEFARRCSRGELARVASGAYVSSEVWDAYDERDRHIVRARVLAAKSARPVTFCHATAALLWGLPWFEAIPDRLDVLRGAAEPGHYAANVSPHRARSDAELVVLDGLRVTALPRTVVDILGQQSFVRAVVVGDAALNDTRRAALTADTGPLDLDDLTAELSRGSRAPRRAGDVLAFLDGRSESAGESISRVSIARAGLAEPELQHSFPPYTVDFWWPEVGVIGEFDGAIKYLDAATRRGKSAEQIVYEEKLREDELRRQVVGFARWTYSEAMSPTQLGRRLREAGVPLVRRTRFAAV